MLSDSTDNSKLSIYNYPVCLYVPAPRSSDYRMFTVILPEHGQREFLSQVYDDFIINANRFSDFAEVLYICCYMFYTIYQINLLCSPHS